MLDYILQHQVEVAPLGPSATPKFYLLHHAVKKEKRNAIEWRIFFDHSSHEQGYPSLNDFLEMGPKFLPEILGVLLRFRLHKLAILGDVSQALLQITLDLTDRYVTRFLWYRFIPNSQGSNDTTNEVIIYRFTRLPFGLTCSPFSFQLTSSRWPRCNTTRTLLRAPLWTEARAWVISQPPRYMTTTSLLSSSKFRR